MTQPALFLFSVTANPDPAFPNPNGWLGAMINGYVNAGSWEEAEGALHQTLETHGWIIEAEQTREIVYPHNSTGDALEHIDHALQHGVALLVVAWDDDEESPDSQTLPDGTVVSDELTLDALGSSKTAIRLSSGQLDFSEESLQAVDELLPQLNQQRAELYTLQYVFAGYVGEVVRRNLGGAWDDNFGLGKIIRGEGFHASPMEWVKARFHDFEKASIAFHYDALKHRLALSQSIEAGGPPPLPDEHSAKLLSQAPLIVFLLVAGADGEIGEKENLRFKKIVDAAAKHPNWFYRRSVAAMQGDFAAHLEELLGVGQMAWMSMLPRLKQEAEAALPDQAPGYIQALIDLAEQIAKSDGGFLGFGGISKEEKAALNIVRSLLGRS